MPNLVDPWIRAPSAVHRSSWWPKGLVRLLQCPLACSNRSNRSNRSNQSNQSNQSNRYPRGRSSPQRTRAGSPTTSSSRWWSRGSRPSPSGQPWRTNRRPSSSVASVCNSSRGRGSCEGRRGGVGGSGGGGVGDVGSGVRRQAMPGSRSRFSFIKRISLSICAWLPSAAMATTSSGNPSGRVTHSVSVAAQAPSPRGSTTNSSYAALPPSMPAATSTGFTAFTVHNSTGWFPPGNRESARVNVKRAPAPFAPPPSGSAASPSRTRVTPLTSGLYAGRLAKSRR